MKNKSLYLRLLCAAALSSAAFNVFAAGSSAEPSIYNYGYAKYTISPYSGSLAVTPFNSESGAARLSSSNYKQAFYQLAPHYSAQATITTCGIASAVMILNTVYANSQQTPPLSKSGSWYIPEDNAIDGNFTWTEENFFNAKVAGLLDKAIIEGKIKQNGKYNVGVGLDQLAKALNLQGLKAIDFHAISAESKDITQFRELVKQITAEPTQYMLVNYNLNVELKLDGGHFAPVAAYDQVSDSVLLLDPWNAVGPWTWIKLVDLYKSMNTQDGKVYRGYILVDAKLRQMP